MINRKTFFDAVRQHPFSGTLSAEQVDGMTRILDEWERRKLTNMAWLAYMLATTFHETSRAMQPVKEDGDESYLKAKAYWPWIGEGLVQVTWEVNHRKFGATAPGQLLTWPVALLALFDGMIKGMFTGRGLGHYFGTGRNDPVGARAIINGTDRAALVASYHYAFLHALAADRPPAQTRSASA